MDRSLAWTLGAPAALATLGYGAGALVAARELPFGAGALTAVLFWSTFLAAALALQMYRRDLPRSTLVAALAGGLGVAGFFGALLGPIDPLRVDPLAPLLFLGLAPLLVATMSAASTLYLARGVRQYRERHGLRHAPR